MYHSVPTTIMFSCEWTAFQKCDAPTVGEIFSELDLRVIFHHLFIF